MKKSLQIFALLFCIIVSAQAPEKFSYQAVIRNASNSLVTNSPVGMKISILKSSAAGTVVYAETQTATTNANGLVSIQIGAGNVLSGTIAGIDWSNDSYYIKTETDPAGGTTYSIAGTSQLLSVPYAMFAKNSGSGVGFTLPYSGTSSANDNTFSITYSGEYLKSAGYFQNTDITNSTAALIGINNSTGFFGRGVYGKANSNSNGNLSSAVAGTILGTGNAGAGVLGQSINAYGVAGGTDDGIGVFGSSNGTGNAGYFQALGTGKALYTNGPIQFENINAGAGKVLTSDAAGNATWQNGNTPFVHFSSLGGSNQVIPINTVTTINSWSNLQETGGANYNPATGEYTVPITGYYSISTTITFNFTNLTNGNISSVSILVDGVTARGAFSGSSIAGSFGSGITVNLEKKLNAGQKVRIDVYQETRSPSNTLFNLYTNFTINLLHE